MITAHDLFSTYDRIKQEAVEAKRPPEDIVAIPILLLIRELHALAEREEEFRRTQPNLM